jgi:DNA processing protein
MNKKNLEKEKLARIKINAFGYMRADWYNKLIQIYGSGEEILKSKAEDISQNGAVTIETARKFLDEARKMDPYKELEKTEKLGGRILIREECGYPQSLKEIIQPPIVLYVRGNLDEESIKIAMVGTRKPTHYGRRMTARLATDLAKCKITLVSGLARGIDSIAHMAVLDQKGTTWAVLGTGLGKYYPAENRKLTEEVVASGGALISEIPFERGPMAFHFPRRNRIIAGLSLMTVVTECPKKSGALITAKIALEEGKDVLAVPGPADSPASEGPNSLIRDGAAIVVNCLDIVGHIPLKYNFLPNKDGLTQSQDNFYDSEVYRRLSVDQKTVIDSIASDNLSLDEIACRLDWSVPKTSTQLFELEAKSILTCYAGKYSRKI